MKAIAISLFLFTCLTGSSLAEDLAAEGSKVYKKCKACHAVGDGAKNKVGPPLNDLFGRRAGTYEGYKYSAILIGLGEAGLVWNRDTFAGYLTKPKKWLVDIAPEFNLDCAEFKKCKGKMAFAGLKKQDDIDALIAYLATFDEDGIPEDSS